LAQVYSCPRRKFQSSPLPTRTFPSIAPVPRMVKISGPFYMALTANTIFITRTFFIYYSIIEADSMIYSVNRWKKYIKFI
jgi:hypothetical protein